MCHELLRYFERGIQSISWRLRRVSAFSLTSGVVLMDEVPQRNRMLWPRYSLDTLAVPRACWILQRLNGAIFVVDKRAVRFGNSHSTTLALIVFAMLLDEAVRQTWRAGVLMFSHTHDAHRPLSFHHFCWNDHNNFQTAIRRAIAYPPYQRQLASDRVQELAFRSFLPSPHTFLCCPATLAITRQFLNYIHQWLQK